MDIPVEELVRYIHSLPYLKRRVEIARIFTPRPNRFLYKYKSIHLDKENSVNQVRDILVKSRLWLSSPDDFNDPYDMSANIVVSTDARERSKRFNTLLKEQGVPFAKRKLELIELTKNPKDFQKIIDVSYKKNIKAVGVFCFAGNAKDILMWSHYADNHKGICIQFEVARDFSMLSQAVSITYSPDYPKVNWPGNYLDSLAEAILRKYKGWEYEDEHRIVRPKEAYTHLKIDPQAVVGVIMGCRVSSEHRKVIEEILEERRETGGPPVRLFTAREHKTKYKLSIVRE